MHDGRLDEPSLMEETFGNSLELQYDSLSICFYYIKCFIDFPPLVKVIFHMCDYL